MFIYKITNKINNKVYIGQSIRPIEKRFQRHINDALNNIIDTHFSRAIRKYGKDNFYVELIDKAENQEELNNKEQYWIKYYDSTNDKKGYNETDALYKCGGNTYQSKTDKDMFKIKEKIKKSKLGINNPNAKSIKCLNVETGEEIIFDTVTNCKNFFEENNHRFITTRVLHQTKSLYKGKWNICYSDEKYIDCPVKANKSGTEIRVINNDSLEENIFESIRLASRTLNISRNRINKYVQNNIKDFVIQNYKFTILD